MVNIEFLKLPNAKCPAEDFLDGLDDKDLAKIFKLVEWLKTEGSLSFPHARKLEGHKSLWELESL